MEMLYSIIASSGLILTALARQVRVHLRDRDDREFAQYLFDQTRSTDALGGFAALVRQRRELNRAPLIARDSPPDPMRPPP